LRFGYDEQTTIKESPMKRVAILLSLLLSSGFAAAEQCEAPAIPEVSTSNTAARRVVKEVKVWRDCSARMADQDAAARTGAEVDAALEKWAEATRFYSQGQANGRKPAQRNQADAARAERDRYNELRERIAGRVN
jgi:hypothetical protein